VHGPVAPHARDAAAAARRRDDDYNIAVAVRKLAEVVGAQGDVAESVRQLRVSLEMFKRLYRDSASTSTSASGSGSGADHPQVALCMRALAHALGKQGSMAESTRLHRESLAMLLRLHGRADDADVASGLSGLAATLQLQGDLPASVRLHTDALAMMVRLLCGSESREMAIVMGDVANGLLLHNDVCEWVRVRR
jgi:hypothetical protein